MTQLLLILALAQSPCTRFESSNAVRICSMMAADVVEEPACRHEGGRVSCSEAGFKTLTDTLIDERSENWKCAIKLSGCETQRDAYKAALLVPPPAPKLHPRSVAALVIGVLGAVAVTSAAAVDILMPELRIAFGIAGSLALATGITLIAF